jgi:hypothetical protein
MSMGVGAESTRAYITYTNTRNCNILKALPHGFARRKKLHSKHTFVELIWKPITFELQVDTDCSLCLSVLTLHVFI